MIFQKEVMGPVQALGNAGQIANDDISVGEFAQGVANNDNEAKSTAGKQVTGSILGVVIKDRLKAVNLK